MKKSHLLFCLAIFISAISTNYAIGKEVAVIVNKDNPMVDISMKELIDIFRVEKQHWKDGKKIVIVLQGGTSREKSIFIKKVYRMEEEQLKKYWLGKIFKGEISSYPTTIDSGQSIKKFVSEIAGSIGFIDSNLVDGSVKVIKIDGKTMKDDGYLLKD